MSAEQPRQLSQALRELLAGRAGVVCLLTDEEERARLAVQRALQDHEVEHHWWTFSEGLDGKTEMDPVQLLLHVREQARAETEKLKRAQGPFERFTFYTALGFGYLDDPMVIRLLRDLHAELEQTRTSIVITQPNLNLPDGLDRLIPVVRLTLPDRVDLREVLEEVVEVEADSQELLAQADGILDALAGLTRAQARLTVRRCLACHGRIEPNEILPIKAEIIRETGVLELLENRTTLDDVGGHGTAKAWFRLRRKAFSPDGKAFIGSFPRGALLLGVPGSGKSLVAKSIGGEWGLPVLQLDVGRVFGSLVGQSEENIRKALQLAETIAPSVLFVN